MKTAAYSSQAIHRPCACQKNSSSTWRRSKSSGAGGEVVLRRIPANLAKAFELLAALPDDFMAEGRVDAPPQSREGL